MGPLGWRLFAVFVLVALASVAVLTTAALVGTGLGLSETRQADRQQFAVRAAEAAGTAYKRADGWPGADLGPARAVAQGAAARLVVIDENGQFVERPHGNGQELPGMGPGNGLGAAGHKAQASVRVDDRPVGSVTLIFDTGASAAAQRIAWGWIAVAAAVALVVALGASWFVTRRLTTPIVRVADTARAIAAGERTARSTVSAPGELGELSRAFDSMADDVDRAEQARRNLAADVAHELRTPLAALQAGLEELRDGLAEPEPQRLAGLHDQSLRLGRIVGDLADLSSAESAALSLRLTDVDLAALVRAELADREPELRTAGLCIRTDLGTRPATVRADPVRLHQAIGNLLSNAARYCRPGDTVTVAVGVEGDSAVVTVSDTGPGIPPDDLPLVFDRLWRGRSSQGVTGSGIGLAVVRELVTAHGGTVRASSPPSGGTAFTISLPWAGNQTT
jgi:two-component system sensor histidine kinase BaeS